MGKNIWLAAAIVLGMLGLAACGAGNAREASEEEIERRLEESPADETESREYAAAEEAGDTENDKEASGKTDEPESEQGGSEEKDAGGNIYVSLEEDERKYEAEDGTLLLTTGSVLPVVTISDNEEAAAAINEYIQSYAPAEESETLEYAEEDYALFGKESWFEYEEQTAFSVSRTDPAVISFLVSFYSYTGGAHPNYADGGLNFSTETGERLTLGDVVKEEEAAVKSINEFLLAEAEKEYGEYLYEDYGQYIGDILTEDTWYLGEDGLHIIVNTYLIAPYVAGSRDFVIPYEEADFLKDEFKR